MDGDGLPEGGRASAARRRTSASDAPVRARSSASELGRQAEPEARLAAAEAVAERPQLGMDRMDRPSAPDRLAEVDLPAIAERLDLLGAPSRSTIGFIVSSSSRV